MTTSNTFFQLAASAARTATAIFAKKNDFHVGCIVVINCTARGGASSVVFTIRGRTHAESNVTWDILASAAVAATGTTVLEVRPGAIAVANRMANNQLPYLWEVIATHANGDSITYSVDGFYCV